MSGRDEREDPQRRVWDRGFDGHRRRQQRLGLAMSYQERLRWLEQTMDEMWRLLGRARDGTQNRR